MGSPRPINRPLCYSSVSYLDFRDCAQKRRANPPLSSLISMILTSKAWVFLIKYALSSKVYSKNEPNTKKNSQVRSEHAALGKASSARGLLWVDLSEKLQAQKRSCSFLREIGINNDISSWIGRAGCRSHKTHQKRHQLTPKLITLVLALPWDFPLTSLFHSLWEERLYFSSCCRWQRITVGKSQWPEQETADRIIVTVKSGEKWAHACLLCLTHTI